MLAERVDVDEPRQIVTAIGDVEITRGNRRLFADKVRYYQVEDRIEAVGNVTLLEPGGQAIYADLSRSAAISKTGSSKNCGRVSTRTRGSRPHRQRLIDGARTEMDQAVYSPCPICEEEESPPLWQITASKVTHDDEAKDVTYNHAFFELYGVPVLYTPYFSHPDPSVDRRSGFSHRPSAPIRNSALSWKRPTISRSRPTTTSPSRRSSPPKEGRGACRRISPSPETAATISAAASPAAASLKTTW